MIIYGWILVVMFIFSMILVPQSIGKVRTVGDGVANLLYHIAILAFVGIYLVEHYLRG